MSGSPPQMETMGASHSVAEARQSSKGIMSLRLVEYSRMRPQPVQVRLQVCSGSSCRTMANRGVRRILCLMMCLAIFAVSANGNRIRFRVLLLQFLGLRLEPTLTRDYALTNPEPECVGADGAWLGGGRGLASPRPGMKKLAGETLWEALIPPHPVRSSPARGRSASQKDFRSNLTGSDYKDKVIVKATTNFQPISGRNTPSGLDSFLSVL